MAMQDDAQSGHEMPPDIAVTIKRPDLSPFGYGATALRQVAVTLHSAKFRHVVSLHVGVAAADKDRRCWDLLRRCWPGKGRGGEGGAESNGEDKTKHHAADYRRSGCLKQPTQRMDAPGRGISRCVITRKPLALLRRGKV